MAAKMDVVRKINIFARFELRILLVLGVSVWFLFWLVMLGPYMDVVLFVYECDECERFVLIRCIGVLCASVCCALFHMSFWYMDQ